MLTLLLALVFTLAGPLAGGSALAKPSDGARTAQVGRHGEHDAVASTRAASSRVRTAAPRPELHLGAAVLPTAPSPSARTSGHPAPDARTGTVPSAPAGGTLCRAPPA